LDIKWEQAKNSLEGVRPYEDGYERDSVHQLIDVGDKLQQKLEAIQELMNEKQYMDEAIILKIKVLEVLNS
jgi:hypothetical protein